MKGFFRKSAIIGLLSIFSLVSLFGITAGVNADVNKPKITISDKNSNSIVLGVKQSTLDREKVTVKVNFEKVATGEKFVRTFKVMLNKEGRKNITIDKLLTGTQYKIKAAIKKRNSGGYSDFSSFKKFSTT
jgi:hypothetical protein